MERFAHPKPARRADADARSAAHGAADVLPAAAVAADSLLRPDACRPSPAVTPVVMPR